EFQLRTSGGEGFSAAQSRKDRLAAVAFRPYTGKVAGAVCRPEIAVVAGLQDSESLLLRQCGSAPTEPEVIARPVRLCTDAKPSVYIGPAHKAILIRIHSEFPL